MFVSRSELVALDNRLRRVEALLEIIAAGLEIPAEEIATAGRPRLSPEVISLVAQGKKIAAVKLLREQQGLDLASAKRAVDEL